VYLSRFHDFYHDALFSEVPLESVRIANLTHAPIDPTLKQNAQRAVPHSRWHRTSTSQFQVAYHHASVTAPQVLFPKLSYLRLNLKVPYSVELLAPTAWHPPFTAEDWDLLRCALTARKELGQPILDLEFHHFLQASLSETDVEAFRAIVPRVVSDVLEFE